MQHELITEDDYDNLPEGNGARFVALEAICRRNLGRLLLAEGQEEYDALLRCQYMMTVSAAAAELGIDGIYFPTENRPADFLNDFMITVTREVTRINLRRDSRRHGSVLLGAKTRLKLDAQIRRLRTIIETGDIDEPRRKALLKRLDQLSEEVAKTRLNLGATMTILAFVGMGVATGTSFLADAPDALATITSLIGIDQEAEAAEQKRVGSPPSQKALPPPERKRISNTPAFEPGGMDDDIPF